MSRAKALLNEDGITSAEGLMRFWGATNPKNPYETETLWSLYDDVVFYVGTIDAPYSLAFNIEMTPHPQTRQRFAPHERKEQYLQRQAERAKKKAEGNKPVA